MATEAPLKQDEDENGAPGAPSQASIAPASGQGGGSIGPSIANRNSPSGSSTPNIQAYLRANMGAGQQLSQGIQNQFGKQTTQFGQQVGAAQTDVNKQTEPLESQLGQQAQNTIKTAFQDPSKLLAQQNQQNQQINPLNQSQQDTTGLATPTFKGNIVRQTNTAQSPNTAQPSQYDQFQKLLGGGYSQDITGVQNNLQNTQGQLQSQLGNLQNAAQGANTETGRFQLLRGALGQPGYTQGQQRLDQLFLQAQPGVGRNLQQNLQGQAQQANQQMQGLNTQTQAKLSALNQLANQNQQDIGNLFQTGQYQGQNLGQGTNAITEQSKAQMDAAQQAIAQNPGLQQRISSNQLTPQDIKTLGLTAGQSTYGANIGQFFNPGGINNAPTAASTATPEEVARYQALQQLSGGTDQLFGGVDPTKAGGFQPYNWDAAKAQQEIGNAKDTAFNQFRQALPGFAGGPSATLGGYASAYTQNPMEINLVKSLSGATSPEQAQQIMDQYRQMYAQQHITNGALSADQYFSPEVSAIQNLTNQQGQNILGNAKSGTGIIAPVPNKKINQTGNLG